MPQPRTSIDAWQFTIGIDEHSARRVARDRPCDTELIVLTMGAGWYRVELAAGEARLGSLLLLGDQGLFKVTRRDTAQDRMGGTRTLLMLKACSGPSGAAAA